MSAIKSLSQKIIESARSYGKLRALVREAFDDSANTETHFQAVVDKLYKPEHKVADEPNAPFRSFKSTASTLAKEYSLSVSIKGGKVELAKVEAKPAQDGASAGDGSASGDSGGDSAGMDDSAVMAAVQVVLDNLDNPSVLMAIRAGLEAIAKAA